MQATLKFNLPEDNDEYLCATKARSLRAALVEITDYLRAHEKHTSDKMMPRLPEIRQEVQRIIGEEGLGELFQ